MVSEVFRHSGMRITCLRGVLVLRSIKMKIATFRTDYAKNDDFNGVFRALCLLNGLFNSQGTLIRDKNALQLDACSRSEF